MVTIIYNHLYPCYTVVSWHKNTNNHEAITNSLFPLPMATDFHLCTAACLLFRYIGTNVRGSPPQRARVTRDSSWPIFFSGLKSKSFQWGLRLVEGRGHTGLSLKRKGESVRVETVPFRKPQVTISSSLIFHLNVPMKMQQVAGGGNYPGWLGI